MQWIVGCEPEFHLNVIYIGYRSAVNFLQQNIESTLEFNYKGANILMGFNGPHSELIHHDDTVYEGWIGSKFTFIHKGILVIVDPHFSRASPLNGKTCFY